MSAIETGRQMPRSTAGETPATTLALQTSSLRPELAFRFQMLLFYPMFTRFLFVGWILFSVSFRFARRGIPGPTNSIPARFADQPPSMSMLPSQIGGSSDGSRSGDQPLGPLSLRARVRIVLLGAGEPIV